MTPPELLSPTEEALWRATMRIFTVMRLITNFG
jgi:hypothetical protein